MMSKETLTPDQTCGKCMWFRTNTVGGKSIGIIEIEPGKILKKGLCGAELGLLLGVLNEEVVCRQKPVAFKPKEEVKDIKPQ